MQLKRYQTTVLVFEFPDIMGLKRPWILLFEKFFVAFTNPVFFIYFIIEIRAMVDKQKETPIEPVYILMSYMCWFWGGRKTLKAQDYHVTLHHMKRHIRFGLPLSSERH